VIAGIEIISNEIENPFKGDPNDLPIDDYKKENEKYING
jgi:predicted membrane chloride channel (bestrophin family)